MVSKRVQAIANVRVSSDEQLKSNSLNRQKIAVRELAKSLNVELVHIWSGSVSSKKGNNINRKDLQEMLDFCKQHKRVKYALFDEPDRFMRAMLEIGYFFVEFKKLGVTIRFASKPDLNTDTAANTLMLMLEAFKAEGSNEERQRKSIRGDEAAILDGRYPAHPKLGYMKGDEPAVHKVDPVIGEFMRSVLCRLSAGLIDLTESCKEFNNSDFVKTGKHCPYQLDKWRKIVADPYYCGVVELNKQVQARCEKGRHEPLITREQHEKIVQIVYDKKKTQIGPKPGGNQFFPLNKITCCENCWQKEIDNGRKGIKNRGKYVGFKVINKQNREYGYYRCRLCGQTIKREDLHEDFTELLNSLDFDDDSRERFKKQLKKVWEIEESENETKIKQLRTQRCQIEHLKDELINKLGTVTNETVCAEIERSIETKVSAIKELDIQIADLTETGNEGSGKFMEFALDFVDNLGTNFWELTPEEVRKFKLLAFPDGFFIDSEKIIKIRSISPFIRYKDIKKSAQTSDFNKMVRMKRL